MGIPTTSHTPDPLKAGFGYGADGYGGYGCVGGGGDGGAGRDGWLWRRCSSNWFMLSVSFFNISLHKQNVYTVV